MPARASLPRKKLRVLISSGPTREPIDPVRYLSNYSTGYMGALLAKEALRRGHQVTVVSGPAEVPLPSGARVVAVEQAAEMAKALQRELPKADALIMAAAVADFRVERRSAVKTKRQGRLTLRLRANPDILKGLRRRAGQVAIGFAVETQTPVAAAVRKMRRKRLDAIFVQQAGQSGAPFGKTAVRAWLVTNKRPHAVTDCGRIGKPMAARLLLDKLEALWYGQTGLESLSKRV